MNLQDLGWRPFFEHEFARISAPGWLPARVAREDRGSYLLYSARGEWFGELPGRLRHQATDRADLPAAGDWVAMQPRDTARRATIHAVLPRQSRFSRQAAGHVTGEQVVAANVDTVLLVCGLGHDYNLRRLERYLTLAWDSGAAPAVVLNKADLCDDLAGRLDETRQTAFGVPVHPVSARTGAGVDALRAYLERGRTVALLGSSGVGKSSLVNAILGEERQAVRDVRDNDSHGRHTTTSRELILAPEGGILLDSPGMRELQLWTDADAVSEAFGEIDAIAKQCRFRDCRHEDEPGCAVQVAVQRGELDPERLESFHKLQRETFRLSERRAYRERLRSQGRFYRSVMKDVRRRKG